MSGTLTGGYDVVGDVHGHADRLVALLRELGYAERSGTWRHAHRTAVFVGDLIDTGPQQLEVLRIVRAMIDDGTALAVLGNHEFNAISWVTRDPETGERCRPDTPKNRSQHQAFLAQVGEDTAEHRRWTDWFTTLPMWVDLVGLRVVHACWDPDAMAAIEPALDPDRSLNEHTVVAAADRTVADPGQPPTAYEAVEHLLKGPEVQLPAGFAYADKSGHCRDRARMRWWDPRAITLRRAALVPPGAMSCDAGDGTDPADRPDAAPAAQELPDTPITDRVPVPYTDGIPVVFGHYWCNDRFEVVTDTAVCVDYSAGRGGPLAAYRWSGETKLRRDHLVMVR